MTVVNQWTKKHTEELESDYECKEMQLEEVVNILNMQHKYIELADRYIGTAERVISKLEDQTAERVISKLEDQIEKLENQIEELNKRGDTNA